MDAIPRPWNWRYSSSAPASDASLMTVITARPEFTSPWRGQADVSLIGLDRLHDPDCEGLVRELAAATALQDAIVKEIVSRSDGNPLFLEELSAAVVDARVGAGPVVPELAAEFADGAVGPARRRQTNGPSLLGAGTTFRPAAAEISVGPDARGLGQPPLLVGRP